MQNENISWLKKWIVAVRPFAYPASITPPVLGLGMSYYAGYDIKWILFALTLIGMICFHTAANLLNDCFDYKRGLDTEENTIPTSGAIVRGWLTPSQIFHGAMVFLATGATCGIILVYFTGWPLLIIGLIGTALALTYTTPGLCAKYIGLGDLSIGICFGILPVLGAWMVQTKIFSWNPILWSIPVSLLTIGILHANNWRDIQTDTKKQCRTMAARLGDRGSSIYYRILVLGPFALAALYITLSISNIMPGLAPVTTALTFLAFPLALRLIKTSRTRTSDTFPPLDAMTAQTQLAIGILLPMAFVIARLIN